MFLVVQGGVSDRARLVCSNAVGSTPPRAACFWLRVVALTIRCRLATTRNWVDSEEANALRGTPGASSSRSWLVVRYSRIVGVLLYSRYMMLLIVLYSMLQHSRPR